MMIRRPLLWALTLSALVHACWVVDAEWSWSWPWQRQTPDEVLASKKADAVKRVRLAAKPKAMSSDILQIMLLAPGIRSPAAAQKIASAVKPMTTQINETGTAPAITEPAPAELSSLPDAPAPEPEMTFPLSVLAKQRAQYYGFSMDLTQQWLMEGTRYVIQNKASKFGFKADILSEGQVSPDGLQPERYRLTLNNTLRNYADFDRAQNQLIHGKAGARKIAELTSDMQDMASLPFHVAVTYEGRADRRLMVTTGSSVYEITLHVVAEETLKLPGGTLQTIHLQGNRTRSDGTRQEGYNIWLAPGYRNFPVRFSGPDSKGNLLEMSVSSLAFDGKTVFGHDLPPLPEANSPEGIPLQMQIDHLPDIPSNPTSAEAQSDQPIKQTEATSPP